MWGHRIHYPLADISWLDSYHLPEIKPLQEPALAQILATGRVHRQRYFHAGGGASLFETMQSLRPFEDVLVDIAQDMPEINQQADLLVDYNRVIIDNALAAGVDAVCVGDDFGTQQALMLSPKMWRHFFLPRYPCLFEPVKRAGKRILFHSCGMTLPILANLREAGADAIWPQLSLFDQHDLARRYHELGLALQLHPDRGELMLRCTPLQTRSYLLRLVDELDCLFGGSWLYLEIDPGFP